MNTVRLCTSFILNTEHKLTYYTVQRNIKRWVSPTQKEITRRKRALPPQPEPVRSNFLEWNRHAEVYAFNKRLSENFDMEKLEQAFTCRSYIKQEEQKQKIIGIENPELTLKDNSEYILQGKELTSKIVKKYLIDCLPHVPEEGIKAIHDYLLSDSILAKASMHIGTKDIILTEEQPVAEKTLADTFLALVAVLAESTNFNHTSIFVRDFLIVALVDKDLTELWCPDKPYEILNEILSKEDRMCAEPRIIAQAGKNTLLAAYQIAVYSNKEFLGVGSGQSIQEAKHIAALNALYRIYGLLDFSRPIKFNKEAHI